MTLEGAGAGPGDLWGSEARDPSPEFTAGQVPAPGGGVNGVRGSHQHPREGGFSKHHLVLAGPAASPGPSQRPRSRDRLHRSP